QAFHVSAPNPAITTIVKTPEMILRTVSFPLASCDLFKLIGVEVGEIPQRRSRNLSTLMLPEPVLPRKAALGNPQKSSRQPQSAAASPRKRAGVYAAGKACDYVATMNLLTRLDWRRVC